VSIRDGLVVESIQVESSNNVSCLVFADVSYAPHFNWEDCMLVGIEEATDAPEYKDDFRDYDVKMTSRYEGNILQYNLSVMGGDVISSWRGHCGPIRAMAVVPNKYLVSVSMHVGYEFPEKLIVWDLQDSGMPLRSITFVYDIHRNMPPIFSGLVGGIAICGSNVLLCGNYGDGLIPIHLDESGGSLSLAMKGVLRLGQKQEGGDNYHGHMVGSGKDAILINEAMTDAWIYDIASLVDQPNLRQDFSESDDRVDTDEEEEEWMRHLRDRSRATGKMSFPRRGGAEKKKKEKKRKQEDSDDLSCFGFEGFNFGSSDGDSDRTGGPEVLAINGRYVLAGFRNGAILQGKFLPSSPEREHLSREYGTLASYSAAIPQY
jgi:hypothetical protein